MEATDGPAVLQPEALRDVHLLVTRRVPYIYHIPLLAARLLF